MMHALHTFSRAFPRVYRCCESARRLLMISLLAAPLLATAQTNLPPARIEALKQELVAEIDGQQAFTAQMVDMIFSFGELGFQDEETSKYLTDYTTVQKDK